MSIADVREAFQQAAGDKLRLTNLTMNWCDEHGGIDGLCVYRVFNISGFCEPGSIPFQTKSRLLKPTEDDHAVVRETALRIIQEMPNVILAEEIADVDQINE